MRTILLIIAFWISGTSNVLMAQFRVTGTYSTSFGEIKILEEGNLVYGDYGDRGTIIGEVQSTIGGTKTVRGTFYNKENKGSFEWIFSQDRFYKKKFSGKYGWGTSLSAGAWSGEEANSNQPSNLKFAKWSGKWNTSYGELVLKQDGKVVTGTYRDLGTISGTIVGENELRGTFTNKNDKGAFSFVLNGNSFDGKWGWGSQVGTDKWTGTKELKTNSNATIRQAVTSTTQSPTTTVPATTRRYRVKLLEIEVLSVDDGPEGIFSGYELFGIAWCRAFDHAGNQIKPFDVNYMDQYGRFWEIKPQDYIRTDMSVGVKYAIDKVITFDFPFPGNQSSANVLKNSKIALTVELKDYDTFTKHDILGKHTVTIPLDEAGKFAAGGNPGLGKITFRHGSGHLTVSYQIELL